MKIKDNLKDFIANLSKQHSPFKRENDNQKYQAKYIQIFNLIIDCLPDVESSVQINHKIFKKIYRNYKDILNDLYKDSIIYFYTSETGSLIHGNKGFSKQDKGNYNNSFSAFYKLDKDLINQLKSSEQTFHHNSRISNIDTIQNNKEIDNNNIIIDNNIIEIEYYIINEMRAKMTEKKENILTVNKWYDYLTDREGNKIMEELPHYGQYTDGRIYSKFHAMKREVRNDLRLCGSKIIQVFDISHCFPTLIGVLINGTLDKEDVAAYRHYIMNNDIYIDALVEAGLPITEENRDKIKPYFNKFILSTIKDNKKNMKWADQKNDPELFTGVVKFFQNRFPKVFDFIWNYKTEDRMILNKKKKYVKKKVKILAHHLQIIEKKIIEALCSMIKDIPYITLHDAIYIAEDKLENIKHIDFQKAFRNIINF